METRFGLHTREGQWHSLLPRYLMVAPHLAGKRVLELACGSGLGTALLCLHGQCEVVAVDHRAELIGQAQTQFEEIAPLFQAMPLDKLDLEDDSFDVVLCLDNDLSLGSEPLLQEVLRVLRPEGVLVGSWREEDAYSLAQVLPHSANAHTSNVSQDPDVILAALRDNFQSVVQVAQVPELAFTFHPLEKDALPTWDAPVAPDRREVQLTEGAPRHFDHALVLCSQQAESLEAWTQEVVQVWLPYRELVARLGQLMTRAYRQADESSQRVLILEGQLEDRDRLTQDLEEELRGQRALANDQASRLEEFQATVNAWPVGAASQDLSLQLAHLQGELTDRQTEILTLTADFNRRSQDLLWGLEERNQTISELHSALHQWEKWGATIQRDLADRELALENLGQVLQRQTTELDQFRQDDDAVARKVTQVQPAVGPSSEELKSVIRQLRLELEEAHEAKREAQKAPAQLAKEHRRAQEEMARTRQAAEHQAQLIKTQQDSLDAQEQQARDFAAEVAVVYESRNRTQAQLEAREEELANVQKETKEVSDASMNYEREVAKRGRKITKLERELISKNVEITSLEKENIDLLRRRSNQDKKMVEVTTEADTVKAELARLQNELSAQKESLAQLETTHQAAEKTAQEAQKAAEAARQEAEELAKALKEAKEAATKKATTRKPSTRKTTTRKSTAKPKAEPSKAEPVPEEAPDTKETPKKTTRKPSTRKTTTRKTTAKPKAATTKEKLAEDEPAQADLLAPKAEAVKTEPSKADIEEAPKAPVKKTRRTTRKPAAAKTATTEDTETAPPKKKRAPRTSRAKASETTAEAKPKRTRRTKATEAAPEADPEKKPRRTRRTKATEPKETT